MIAEILEFFDIYDHCVPQWQYNLNKQGDDNLCHNIFETPLDDLDIFEGHDN
jgi:hypothetical protein